MVTPRSTRRCADLKMAPLDRAFVAYDKSVHSIFITNGLGICSARRLADLWRAGLLHFITTSKSRHIPRDRERETAFLTPRAIPACTGAGRNKACVCACVTESRSHLIPRPGRFHSCVFDIRFFFSPRCSLFIRWLPAPRFRNYFFFSPHVISVIDKRWLPFSVWLLRRIAVTTAQFLTTIKRAMTCLCSQICYILSAGGRLPGFAVIVFLLYGYSISTITLY